MKNIKQLISLGVLAIVVVPTFLFGDITISNVQGTWTPTTYQQPGGEIYVQGAGTSTLSWGAGGTFNPSNLYSLRSGYIFDPIPNTPPPPPIVLGSPFVIGTFTQVNRVIKIGSAITGATLTTQLTINIDGTTENLTFSFPFLHDETANKTPCSPGSVSVCDDSATLTSNALQSKQFTIGNTVYDFTLLGFYYNGNIFSSLLTQENANSTVQLLAEITTVTSVVPEPSTYLILGSVLIGCVYLKRRKMREEGVE